MHSWAENAHLLTSTIYLQIHTPEISEQEEERREPKDPTVGRWRKHHMQQTAVHARVT